MRRTDADLITIRPTTMGDLDDIMSWVNDKDVVANIANIQHVTRAQEKAWLKATLASKEDRLYSIFKGDTYIGQCGIHKIYWPARNGRIGIILKKKYQGDGNGTAALKELLRIAFDGLHLHKVFCIVWEDNPQTLHLYRDKLGMEEEGRLIDEYFLNGKHHNMVRLYMLDHMWQRMEDERDWR